MPAQTGLQRQAHQGRAPRRKHGAAAEGIQFEAQLFDALRNRLASAYAAAGQESVTGFWRVLEGLIPAEDKAMVVALQRDI